jgi:N-acetyltransferase 10
VDLLNFWKKNGFDPVYLRQVPNELTGEHSCIVINPMTFNLRVLRHDFMKRYLPLLSFSFRNMPTDLALTMALDVPAHAPHKMAALVKVDPVTHTTTVDGVAQASYTDIQQVLSEADVHRLTLFSTSYVDVSTILDLVPTLSKLYFTKRIFRRPDGTDGVLLSNAQAAVLLAVGLQCTAFDDMATSSTFRGVQPQQLRAFFSKAIARIMEHINALRRQALGTTAADEGAELTETAVVDATGKVVGLSVARQVVEKTNVDTSLMRDAKGARKSADLADAPARKLRKK